MLGFVERYDLILCPVADEPAVPLGVEGNGIYCLPYSLTGYPMRRGAGRDVARGPADRRAGGGPAVAGGHRAGGGGADRDGPRRLEPASALTATTSKPAVAPVERAGNSEWSHGAVARAGVCTSVYTAAACWCCRLAAIDPGGGVLPNCRNRRRDRRLVAPHY